MQKLIGRNKTAGRGNPCTKKQYPGLDDYDLSGEKSDALEKSCSKRASSVRRKNPGTTFGFRKSPRHLP